jgi:hypothetical protein
MIWVFKQKEEPLTIRTAHWDKEKQQLTPYTNGFCTFRWRNPKQSLWSCTKNVFLDFENGTILQIKKIYHNLPCGGSGWLIPKQKFIEILKNG